MEKTTLKKNKDGYGYKYTELAEIHKYLEENISAYLYKTAKQFNSDIVGFGKYAVGYFKTLDEWQDYNWLYNYRNSFFDVTVNSDIKSTYLLMDN